MAFFDGLTHREIAEMTGQPVAAVKSSLRNALLALREAYRP
jgi:RNA polymerase sigma-70 factor (ECF subfamily)